MKQMQSSTSLKRTLLTLSVILLVGIGTGLMVMQMNTSKTPAYLASYGGDFTLQSVNGPVSLSDFKGKVVAIYFGYTSCPDICPTTLANLASAIGRLEEALQDKVQILLITFDPERDTPQVLADYVSQFHPQIIGLSGTPEQIEKVASQYGALYERVDLENSAIKYVFDHSSVSAIVDTRGDLRSLVRHQDPIETIAMKFREAME